MLLIRHSLRFTADLALFVLRSGRWWLPVLVVAFLVAAVAMSTTQAVLPVVAYTLF